MKRTLSLLALFLAAWLLPVGAHAQITVVGSLSQERRVVPGETVSGTVDVLNTSDEEQQVLVYQTDYLHWADGRNAYGDPGSTPRSNADWMSVAPEQFSIPAKEMRQVSWSVTMPAGVDLAGSYWSLLMIEAVGTRFEATPQKGKTVMGINTVIRYGVQMVTTVEAGASVVMTLAEPRLLRDEAGTRLELDVQNDGNRKVSPVAWLEVYDASGQQVARLQETNKGIFPTCSVRFTFPLSSLASGVYQALVVVDNGDDHVVGAQYTIEI